MCNTPILYIVFNRLDTVQQTFPRIKSARPKQLFIAADGPRTDKDGEAAQCAEVRSWILTHIDWECETHTLFRDTNLGCGKAVSGAITWFFQNVPQGIILEDDCLPSASFFSYCEELLRYYKDDKRIMHIAGDNPLTNCEDYAYSYYFSPIQHCWGWATWKDRWDLYRFTLSDIEPVLKTNPYFSHWGIKRYWRKIFKEFTSPDAIHTWDFQWLFAILKANGLCINPAKNLVTNIGFLGDTTHFGGADYSRLSQPNFEIENIIHPSEKIVNPEYISRINKISFGINTSLSSIIMTTSKDFVYKTKKRIKEIIVPAHG